MFLIQPKLVTIMLNGYRNQKKKHLPEVEVFTKLKAGGEKSLSEDGSPEVFKPMFLLASLVI